MTENRVWVIIYCTATGRTLLAKRSRHVKNSDQWGFFGGNVDDGENMEAAARRELIEEAGIHGDLKLLGSLKSGVRKHLYYMHTMEAEEDPVLNREHSKFRWIKNAKKLDLHGPAKYFFNSKFVERFPFRKSIVARVRHYLIAKRLPLQKNLIPRARGSYGALVATMRPKDFILLTVADRSNIKTIMDETKVGLDKYNKNEYNMPSLIVNWDTGKVLGHEGRHRAAMIIKEGGDKFPVVIFFRREYHVVTWNESAGPEERYYKESRKFTDEKEADNFYWELRQKARESGNIEKTNIETYTETVKGSPRGSDESKYHHVPFTKDDMPPYLFCQFNNVTRVDTGYMKVGLVKGYNHFK